MKTEIKILNFFGNLAHGLKISRGSTLNEKIIVSLLEKDGWVCERSVKIENMVVAGRKKKGHTTDIVAKKNGKIRVIDVKSNGESNTTGVPEAFLTKLVAACKTQFGDDVEIYWMRICDDINTNVEKYYGNINTYKKIGINVVNAHMFFNVDINSILEIPVVDKFVEMTKQKMEPKYTSQRWEGLKPIDIIIYFMKTFNISIDDIKDKL